MSWWKLCEIKVKADEGRTPPQELHVPWRQSGLGTEIILQMTKQPLSASPSGSCWSPDTHRVTGYDVRLTYIHRHNWQITDGNTGYFVFRSCSDYSDIDLFYSCRLLRCVFWKQNTSPYNHLCWAVVRPFLLDDSKSYRFLSEFWHLSDAENFRTWLWIALRTNCLTLSVNFICFGHAQLKQTDAGPVVFIALNLLRNEIKHSDAALQNVTLSSFASETSQKLLHISHHPAWNLEQSS